LTHVIGRISRITRIMFDRRIRQRIIIDETKDLGSSPWKQTIQLSSNNGRLRKDFGSTTEMIEMIKEQTKHLIRCFESIPSENKLSCRKVNLTILTNQRPELVKDIRCWVTFKHNIRGITDRIVFKCLKLKSGTDADQN